MQANRRYFILMENKTKTKLMESKEIRKRFLEFFNNKDHRIIKSAPMVVKNDPSLMFTNAGMNQFKDIFLGTGTPISSRVANSQKCLRVSGKHNDLDEVGRDTYHHTMFEMLGNWSFGDYFKEEAIAWAWEFLTKEMKLDSDRLYITVFGGSPSESMEADEEAREIWSKHVVADRILDGSRKDNFWEMGETGPCGPCSEIHIDLRPNAEREKQDGKELVNENHPQVVEIWNLVFIQYNRKVDGSFLNLPQKHVDTGMGFERLCMAMQNKLSNYDTDVFTPIISKIEELSGKQYGVDTDIDIAMRVVADHLRAVAFAIADGQLPSNVKAGYVIRRILRRSVRYAYSFLNQKEAFMYKLLPTLTNSMGDYFPELKQQEKFIGKVMLEEEQSFLRTLEKGINLLNDVIEVTKSKNRNIIDGADAFVLYDTYGFPFDLTELIVKEKGFKIDETRFKEAMDSQKARARQAANVDADDWTILLKDDVEEFIGYDRTEAKLYITKYRKVVKDKKTLYQLVFQITPFYAESGGQVGDQGYIESNGEKIYILDTKNENNQIVHYTENLPSNLDAKFNAIVNTNLRSKIMSNHSATHLMHHALRTVLGAHVEQKGSMVNAEHLRFDFTHFQKLSEEEIRQVELIVNSAIRENIALSEKRNIPIEEAQEMGAMALFGEKYGDLVRVIQFGESIELCGGTHVAATGQIGFFRITNETAIAAGIRRIEAITADVSEEYIFEHLDQVQGIKQMIKSGNNLLASVQQLIDDNKTLKQKISVFEKQQLIQTKNNLKNSAQKINDISIISKQIEVNNAADLKEIAFQLKGETDKIVCVLGAVVNNKPNLCIMISDILVEEYKLNAGSIIREAAKAMQGGGGGQAFLATAGGKNPDGVPEAISIAEEMLSKALS